MQLDLKTIRGDILGGITASVVALPIGMAFGIASGMGILAGLYGAVALCLIGSIFGGTKTQISGPTAPMTVAMTVVIATYADSSVAQALVIVVFAGLIQVLLGLSRIGRFVVYTPYVVISGFMTGIGLIIVLVHLPPILGSPTPGGGAMGAVNALPEAFAAVNLHAVFVALVTIVTGFLWPKQFRRFIPAPLLGLIAGGLLGYFWRRASFGDRGIRRSYPSIVGSLSYWSFCGLHTLCGDFWIHDRNRFDYRSRTSATDSWFPDSWWRCYGCSKCAP